MAPLDFACRICLVRDIQGLTDCGGGVRDVDIRFVSGFTIPEFGHFFAYSTIRNDHVAKWMVPGDSACQIGLGRDTQGLAECGGGVDFGFVRDSQCLEFRNVFACSTTTNSHMAKWMIPSDSGCQIALVHDSQYWLNVVAG